MSRAPNDLGVDTLRKFYLNRLDASEQAMVAERILGDVDVEALADEVADQLVVEYVDGQLEDADRRTIADLCAMPEWKRRLDLIRGLRELAQRETRHRRFDVTSRLWGIRWRQSGLSAAAMFAAAVGLGLWFQERGETSAAKRRISELETVADSLRAESRAAQASTGAMATVEWALFPSTGLRGADAAPLLQRRGGLVKLQLAVDGSIPEGRLLALITVGADTLGRHLIAASEVRRTDGVIAFTIAESALPAGRSELTLVSARNDGPATVVARYQLNTSNR